MERTWSLIVNVWYVYKCASSGLDKTNRILHEVWYLRSSYTFYIYTLHIQQRFVFTKHSKYPAMNTGAQSDLVAKCVYTSIIMV